MEPGQDCCIRIQFPDKKKYYCKWKVDNEEIDLEYIQGDGDVQCCWKAPVMRGPFTLGLTISHMANRQEVVDWEETFQTEITAIPLPEALYTSMDNVSRMVGEAKSMRSGLISDNGGEPTVRVRHEQSVGEETENQALWVAIRNRSKAIGFGHYSKFLANHFCGGDPTSTE